MNTFTRRSLTSVVALIFAFVTTSLAQDLRISEIRIDQPGADTDEYFEIVGAPGTALDGLTYVVIGDHTAGSGVIEEVTGLSGLAIPPDGYLLVGDLTFSLATPDLTTSLNFENNDNVTHLLVKGFTGSNGQDLDTDDDGTLDITPWTEIVDLVALIKQENPPAGTEWHYGPPTVGPAGSATPSHAYYCSGGWLIGAEDVGIDDTPGVSGCCLTFECYYDTVDTTNGMTLRQTLHDVIDDHIRFPYTDTSTDTWDIINLADEDPNNTDNIIDLYKNASYAKIPGGVGPYNREHSWPKSYGFPNDNIHNYPYSDVHNLFACDASYNSSRSNKPFRTCAAACSEKPTEFNDGRGGGTGVYPGNSNWTMGSLTEGTWETWDGRKGDVARAMFYMDVRYEGGIHGVTGSLEPNLILTDSEVLIDSGNTGSNESVAYMGMLSVLLQWHEQDPVDSYEIWRNEVVFSFQGNRNPFIDHPEWVACVYSGTCWPPPPPCGSDPVELCLLDGQYAVTARFMRDDEWHQARPMTVLDHHGEPSQKTGGMAFGDPETMSISIAVRPACSGGFSADWAAVGSMDLAQWQLTIRRIADGKLWTRQQDLGGNTSELDQQAFPCL